jgi:hypothetical protein
MHSQSALPNPWVAGASRHSLPSVHPHAGRRSRLSAYWPFFAKYSWILLAILAVAWYLRARDPNYSSAFMDESIYIVYGRMFLAGQFEAPLDHPLHFSFGWYLWPALAAAADRIGGLAGVRELAAVLSVVTVAAVFGFARRLFSPLVGLATAAIFALLGPAVLASRIATRDAGAISFFALGLWLYIRAWQEDESPSWLAAALSLFAAFLCKYLVAIYFPFLVLLALLKRGRAGFLFALSLSLLCGGYGFWHGHDLIALLSYARAYGSLEAPASEAWKIYFTERLDFWLLLLLSPAAWKSQRGASRRTILLMWAGAALLPLFQLYSRADYDYWKHVNYSFLFLAPVAMQGLLRLLRGMSGRFFPSRVVEPWARWLSCWGGMEMPGKLTVPCFGQMWSLPLPISRGDFRRKAECSSTTRSFVTISIQHFASGGSRTSIISAIKIRPVKRPIPLPSVMAILTTSPWMGAWMTLLAGCAL